MRLLSFHVGLIGCLLLLAGCASAPSRDLCDPYVPPNCTVNSNDVPVRPI